jgi:hypothetical protein
MDRDPSENRIDPEERVSRSTGASDTGETGDQRAREEKSEHDKLRRGFQSQEDRKQNNNGVN